MREDRIRCDNELDINNIKVTLISSTNQEMEKYIGISGKLSLFDNILFDAINFSFLAPSMTSGGIISSYLMEVFETENNISFITRNSTYIFKKEIDV